MADNDSESMKALAGKRYFLNLWYLVDILEVTPKQSVALNHGQQKALVDVTDLVLLKAGAMPTEAQLCQLAGELVLLQVRALKEAARNRSPKEH